MLVKGEGGGISGDKVSVVFGEIDFSDAEVCAVY